MKPGVYWDKSLLSILYRTVVVVMFFVMAMILIVGVLCRMLGWSDAAAPIWAIEKHRNPPPKKKNIDKEEEIGHYRPESRVEIGSSDKHVVRAPVSDPPSYLFLFPCPR